MIANKPDIDPSLGTFIIDFVIKPTSLFGVIASCGSQKDGWALFIENGLPGFVVAHNQHLQFVDGTALITGKWSHLVAVIENYTNTIKLFANGKLIGQRQMLLPIHTIDNKSGDITFGQDSGELIDPRGVSVHPYEGFIQRGSFYREKMSDSKMKDLSLSN